MNAFYLIGEHLPHSFSVEIHRSFDRYDYALRELKPEELEPFLKAREFSGLNVTIPYKQAVIPHLDYLDEQAAAIGAVNTIVNRDGKLWGYNTDFGGMSAAISRLIQRASSILSGQKVLILGTGGTSRTALAVCKALGAGETLRVSRTGKDGTCTYAEAITQHWDADWIINCTPAGMYPNLEESPLSLPAPQNCHSERSEESAPLLLRHSARSEESVLFPQLQGVFDCVYNPLRTRLVLAAQACGLAAEGGLYMLVRQAALACELFTGTSVTEAQIEQAYETLHRRQENLVLIGMPGAGKTTVGRLLAAKTGKSFVDLDEEIAQRAGKSIPAIFAEVGEPGFRELESEVIQAITAENGMVIATGGGAILRAKNVIRLKQNGRLVFLDRPFAELKPTADRPLGDTKEKLCRLYEARYPIYCAVADLVLDASLHPEQLADMLAAQ